MCFSRLFAANDSLKPQLPLLVQPLPIIDCAARVLHYSPDPSAIDICVNSRQPAVDFIHKHLRLAQLVGVPFTAVRSLLRRLGIVIPFLLAEGQQIRDHQCCPLSAAGDVSERLMGTEDSEHIGRRGDAAAQECPRSVIRPYRLVTTLSAAASYKRSLITSRPFKIGEGIGDSTEIGRADDHVQLVQLAI